jgi:negative regulator of flagellin synthesis FlgM
VKVEKSNKPVPIAPAGEGQARAPEAKRGATASPQPSSSGGTSVHLGTTSAHLLSMEASMANTPLVDAAKVAEIKQAISEGRFQVHSDVVADRLIETVKELINTQKT